MLTIEKQAAQDLANLFKLRDKVADIWRLLPTEAHKQTLDAIDAQITHQVEIMKGMNIDIFSFQEVI